MASIARSHSHDNSFGMDAHVNGNVCPQCILRKFALPVCDMMNEYDDDKFRVLPFAVQSPDMQGTRHTMHAKDRNLASMMIILALKQSNTV